MTEVIMDICTQEQAQVRIKIESGDGVSITTHYELQEATICWLVQDENEPPMLYVYADPDIEEPTHKIDLSSLFDN